MGYCETVRKRLESLGVRCVTDYSNEKISYKVNDASMKKIPYILVCGAKESETGGVSVRKFGSMKNESMSLDGFIEMINGEMQ